MCLKNRISITMFNFVLFLSFFFNNVASKDCYWNSKGTYDLFSSKSSYDSIRGDIRDSVLKIDGCEPTSIWGILRHGRRYPSVYYKNKIMAAVPLRDEILVNYNKGIGSMCAQDVENLMEWKVPQTFFENEHLTEEGYKEVVGIANRFKEVFLDLLENVEEGDFTIRSDFGQMITETATAFLEGLNNKNVTAEYPLKESDNLAPFKACEKYLKEVRMNQSIYAESEAYLNSSEYRELLNGLHNRTGIDFSHMIENVTALYDLCRFTWVKHHKSPWCAVFTNKDIQVLEYNGDLRHYYRNGYGAPMNKEFGEVAMADLLRWFTAVKNGERKKISAHFSHATMMDMVFTALELFKDDPPITGAFRDPERKWRSSKSGFSGNIVAVLNRCNKDDVIDYKVVFYLNEELLTDMCEDGACTWQEFEDKFKPFLNTTIDFC